MAAYVPGEHTPLPSPYYDSYSDEMDGSPNTVPSPSDIPYQYYSDHVETPPPTHIGWYNANDPGDNYDLDSSYGSYAPRSENEPVITYEATGSAFASYTAEHLWNLGPVHPTHLATVSTALCPTSASSSPVNAIYYNPPPCPPPGFPFASPTTPARVEKLSGPQTMASGYELHCLWGTPACGHMLSDGSSATVRAHLRDAHDIGLGAGTHNTKRASARCLWGGTCSLNSEHILVSGMAKHVATCHLKTTRLSCASCGQLCSRQDALRRHAELYCPAVKQAGEYEPKRPGSQGGGSSRRELQ